MDRTFQTSTKEEEDKDSNSNLLEECHLIYLVSLDNFDERFYILLKISFTIQIILFFYILHLNNRNNNSITKIIILYGV